MTYAPRRSRTPRGRPVARCLLLTALCLGRALAAPVPTNSPPGTLSFDAFKVIPERNIFDPNHRPVTDAAAALRPVDPAQLARAEGFALVGTLISDKGAFAFFDGTDPKYHKVLPPSGTIGDYRIVAIQPKAVDLAAGSNRVEMPVGMQMKRVGQDDWRLMAGAVTLAGAGDAGSSEHTTATNGVAGAESAADPATSAILKRLMQQREKE